MQKNIKSRPLNSDTLVQFHSAWYGYKDGEIEDIHKYNYGKVLTSINDEALVLWFNNEDNPHIETIEDITISWIKIKLLTTINQ